MLDPTIFAEFCDAYTQETNRFRMESRAHIDGARSELERIDREEKKLMDLYLKDALSIDAVKERGDKLKERKAELSAFLANADEPPPLLHPAMAGQYRLRVQQLYASLQNNSDEQRVEAADVLRTLVQQIILTPVDGKIQIDVRGDLAGILAISVQTKKPAGRAGSSQGKMVAGAGFDHNLRQQKGRPVGAADLCELASQVKLVAGRRNHRYRHSIQVAI
ncbi:hypothetical protein [Bradyrhizobium sp. USDA 4463]